METTRQGNIRIQLLAPAGINKKPLYQIEEVVTPNGLYITWPGVFTTKEAAQAEIDQTLNREGK